MRLIVTLAIVSVFATRGARADRRLLRLHDLYRGVDISVRPFGRYGIPTRGAWLRLSHFWRSRQGGRQTVHPRLVRTLAQVQRHFGGRRLELLSGYRAPPDATSSSSYHQVGHAADLSIPVVANRTLFEYCRTLPRLGCGYYPRGRHVHIDVRSEAAIWVDVSGYRGRADYVSDPMEWLRVHPTLPMR